MMYSALTQLVRTGTSEVSLMDGTPGTDYVGEKQYCDPALGYLGGFHLVTEGVSDSGVPSTRYRGYIGTVKLFDFQRDQEAQNILTAWGRLTVRSISSDTLTLGVDLLVNYGQVTEPVICPDVEVDRTLAHESKFLDDFDITIESSDEGHGVKIRQLLVN